MKKQTKIWIAAASAMILIGIIIFGGVMSMLNWDFKKLSTVQYETNRYEINETVENISIALNTADLTFAPSEDGKLSVVCYEQSRGKHIVKAENGALTIQFADTKAWYEHIGIDFQHAKITVFLPAGEYGALSVRSTTGHTEIPNDFQFKSMDISTTTGGVQNKASASENIRIHTTTGHIGIDGVNAASVALSVSTGKITVTDTACETEIRIRVSTGDAKLTDVSCATLSSEGSTGDLLLKNVIASEKLEVRRSTGDVKLEGCDAGEIFVKTSTGKISGTLLSDKFFVCHSDTGSVRVPENGDGGRCELSTDTGNIGIEILK